MWDSGELSTNSRQPRPLPSLLQLSIVLFWGLAPICLTVKDHDVLQMTLYASTHRTHSRRFADTVRDTLVLGGIVLLDP